MQTTSYTLNFLQYFTLFSVFFTYRVGRKVSSVFLLRKVLISLNVCEKQSYLGTFLNSNKNCKLLNCLHCTILMLNILCYILGLVIIVYYSV